MCLIQVIESTITIAVVVVVVDDVVTHHKAYTCHDCVHRIFVDIYVTHTILLLLIFLNHILFSKKENLYIRDRSIVPFLTLNITDVSHFV